jgi:hypothetical protein
LHRAQLLRQRGLRADAVLLYDLQRVVDARQRVLHRLDHLLDRLLTHFEIDRGGLLELRERCLREIQEGLIVLPEGLGRECGECIAQLGFRIPQQRELF